MLGRCIDAATEVLGQRAIQFSDGHNTGLFTWAYLRELAEQRDENERLAERNAALEAEVLDLKQGLDAVEERARSELGMIKEDEVFYQIVEDK